MTIRAVFFDFGGVLQRTEYQAPRQQLAQRFGMDYDDIDKLVFGGESARRASVGEITEDVHWASVLKRLKRPDSEMQSIKDEFFAGDVIDHELVEFIRSLGRKVHVGLISNAWDGMRPFLEKSGLIELFATVIISAEVGVMKPEAKIYHLALEQAQVQANEAVFVDDVPVNIEACEKVGMKGVLFKNQQDAVKQLKQILKR
ncbi:MAG TPA: HAD family phosphatase [Anaerolineales bacterium]|nr:HAD family phosphatase [Anaerolineales bacterium]HNN12093.1 HAD family phosphatase [Anaerolineales bacterium]